MARRPSHANRSRPAKVSQSSLRIVGGQWRSRKLSFPAIEGLRPTPDRVRETLFNWLAPYIAGARCLDLYTGSGALGLEALSRGAASATFVDRDRLVTEQIRANLALLKSDQGQVIQANANDWLKTMRDQPFDIVFMDPPFRQGLVADDAALLVQQNLLAEQAIIYVETESELRSSGVPTDWHEHRKKRSGQVTSYLYFRQPQDS